MLLRHHSLNVQVVKNFTATRPQRKQAPMNVPVTARVALLQQSRLANQTQNLIFKKNVFAKTNTGEKKSNMPPPTCTFGDNLVKEDGNNSSGDDSARSEAGKPTNDRSGLGGLVGGLEKMGRINTGKL